MEEQVGAYRERLLQVERRLADDPGNDALQTLRNDLVTLLGVYGDMLPERPDVGSTAPVSYRSAQAAGGKATTAARFMFSVGQAVQARAGSEGTFRPARITAIRGSRAIVLLLDGTRGTASVPLGQLKARGAAAGPEPVAVASQPPRSPAEPLGQSAAAAPSLAKPQPQPQTQTADARPAATVRARQKAWQHRRVVLGALNDL